jgi:hypothetical protein
MLAVAGVVTWLGYLVLTYGVSQVAGQNYGFKDLAIPGRFTLGSPAPDSPGHSLTGSTPGGTGTGPGTQPFNPKTGAGGNPSLNTCCRDPKTGKNMGPVPASGVCPNGQIVSYLQA